MTGSAMAYLIEMRRRTDTAELVADGTRSGSIHAWSLRMRAGFVDQSVTPPKKTSGPSHNKQSHTPVGHASRNETTKTNNYITLHAAVP